MAKRKTQTTSGSYFLIFICSIVVLLFAWRFVRFSGFQPTKNITALPIPTVQPTTEYVAATPVAVDKDWNSIAFESHGYTFFYPIKWQLRDQRQQGTAGTEFFFSAAEALPLVNRQVGGKNIFHLRANSDKWWVGYENEEWFQQLQSVKIGQKFSDLGKNEGVKIAEGKTVAGQDYVLFDANTPKNYQGESWSGLLGYVLDGQTLIEFRLDEYDVLGKKLFLELIPKTEKK